MTTPAPPAELTYGTIKWYVFGFVADTPGDVNDVPDVLAVNGRAFITMDIEGDGVLAQELVNPATIIKVRTELLIVNGRLRDKSGHDFAKLLANDSPGLSQTGWTYTIEYELDDGLTFGSFSFELHTDEVLDLTMAVPLGSPSPGVVITKGAKGDAGTIAIGTVLTGAPGSNANVTNVGTPTAAILDLTIPRGDPGDGSVNSVNGDLGPDVVLTAAQLGAIPNPGDPGADRILFWDDSASVWTFLTLGTGLSISGTTITGTATPPTASATVSGIVELADNTETITGTDATRAVTPASLNARVATATATGLVELATTAEATAGTDTTRAVTAAGVKAVGDTKAPLTHNHTSANITDFVEAVQDAVGAFFGAGTGATVTYDDVANTITVSATGGTTDPEVVRDAIGAALIGVGVISIVINDAGDTITISSTATVNSTDAALRDRTTHTGLEPITAMPAGMVMSVAKSGGVWPNRPTSRTDVMVMFLGVDPPPAIVTSPAVNGMYAGDIQVTP